jgi:hypothetical protein
LICGCSASKGKVTLQGDQSHKLYAQSFNQAYISGSHDGEYDVVLIQDPPAPKEASRSWKDFIKRSADSQKPLQPVSSSASVRQVVHIHVFWQAAGGSVARDGVVTNAAIDWYVIARDASDEPQVLRYEGAGYVIIDEGRLGTTINIRDGSMKMTQARGDLQDPFGLTKLIGTVKAQRNSQFVRDTMSDIRAQTAGAKTVVSEVP